MKQVPKAEFIANPSETLNHVALTRESVQILDDGGRLWVTIHPTEDGDTQSGPVVDPADQFVRN